MSRTAIKTDYNKKYAIDETRLFRFFVPAGKVGHIIGPQQEMQMVAEALDELQELEAGVMQLAKLEKQFNIK